jgi:hypothetical protein
MVIALWANEKIGQQIGAIEHLIAAWAFQPDALRNRAAPFCRSADRALDSRGKQLFKPTHD